MNLFIFIFSVHYLAISLLVVYHYCNGTGPWAENVDQIKVSGDMVEVCCVS